MGGPKPAHLRRSGENARGAALLNGSDELPNTNSGDWAGKFAGKSSTKEVLGIGENLGANPSYKEVATAVKRPLAARSGGGHTSGGKCPKTLQRRLADIMEVLKAEADREAEYLQIEERLKYAMSDTEKLIVPEAERLGYSQVHMYIKVQACRIYFAYRAQGHSAIAASEEGCYPSMVSGSTVRSWANDFKRAYQHLDRSLPKEPYTFSPYLRGGHVEWLLSNEVLARKAQKWICANTEKKGEANMDIAAFQRFLVGVYDNASATFTEKGLLSDVLEAKGKEGLCLETCRLYLHRLGYTYDFARKNVYADGFDRPDVVEYRNGTFLPAMEAIERRGYYWVPEAWLEVKESWPTEEGYAKWVAEGKPEVHIDAFEWKNEKTPNGIDRFKEWGERGGVLSKHLLPDERPVILLLQDETTIAQYDYQKKCWRKGGAAMSLAAKNEGPKVMYSGYIEEISGSIPILTEAKVKSLNDAIAAKMQGQSAAAISAAQHDIAALRAEGVITEVDEKGMPIASAEKVTASKLFNVPCLEQLQIGKNQEGDWDGHLQLKQALKAQRVAQILYPGHDIYHVYDWSSGHHLMADDALNVHKMNAKPGGKQPKMHDTTIAVTECGKNVRNLQPVPNSSPPRYAQSMVFQAGDVVLVEKGERPLRDGDALIGQAKGAFQIAKERDVCVKGMHDDEGAGAHGGRGRCRRAHPRRR